LAQAGCDLLLDSGHGFVIEDLMPLRVTSGQLWKQRVDHVEFWDDVTHDQAGAEVISEVVPLPQSFVRRFGEIRAYQDWSLELHGYATSFCHSIREFPTAHAAFDRPKPLVAIERPAIDERRKQ
jgi:hypothetical protein